MKPLSDYTIYCTESQTKKALELGASISRIPINGYDGSRPSYFTKNPDEEGYAECPAYYIPTAEQMIGWLEEQIENIDVLKYNDGTWFYLFYPLSYSHPEMEGHFQSRKEATLAGIDKALEYIIDNKI